GPALIDQSTLPTALKDQNNVYAADNEVNVGDAATALSGAAQTASARYFTPFQMHAPMAGSAAVADYDGTTLTVWSGTQGPVPLRDAITALVNRYDSSFTSAGKKVRVIYTEQSGCYGHDGADDVAAEAALIAYRINGPVKLQWMRQEENQWEP